MLKTTLCDRENAPSINNIQKKINYLLNNILYGKYKMLLKFNCTIIFNYIFNLQQSAYKTNYSIIFCIYPCL